MELIVRPVATGDKGQWNALYQGYGDFYKVTQTQEMRDTVWSWLFDETRESEGLVAEKNGQLLGIAHFRPFARPLSASVGGFLDDLFVSPDARGTGAADALIAEITSIAAQRGWSIVRWITAENNYRGRGMYDRVADKTNWVTYDINI